MNILQLVGELGTVGGLEIYVQRLSRSLTALGHQTTVLTEKPPSKPVPYTVEVVPGFLHGGTDAARQNAEAQVLQAVERIGPDVVLSHTTANARLLRALNARVPTAEFVHMFLCGGGKLFRHGDTLCTHPVGARCLADWYLGPCGSDKDPRVAWQSHLKTTAHLSAIKTLPAVLVATDFMRDYLLGEGLDARKLHVAEYNLGIPLPQQERLPPRGGETVTLLFVGRLVYNKGVQAVLDAMPHLEERFVLRVVGDGWYRAALEHKTKYLGLEGRVTFTGFLQGAELEAQYAAANVALVPSLWPEPAGLVVPEARGRGLPVVAFDVGGIPEWEARYDYDAVYLARPGDARRLAEMLKAAAMRASHSPVSRPATPPRPVADILRDIVPAAPVHALNAALV